MAASDNDTKYAAHAAGDPVPTRETHGNVTVIRDPDNPDVVTIRTRKRKRRSKSKRGWARLSRGQRAAIIVVAVIALLAAGSAIAVAALVSAGDSNLHLEEATLEEAPADVKVNEQDNSIEYKGHHYVYDKDVVSVMFVGHDDESGYTTRENANCNDANVLLTLNTRTNEARAIMVPRNSYVYVDVYQGNTFTETKQLQLSLAYAVDVETEDQRAENVVKAVSRIFYGTPIKYYVAMDEAAIADASTAVGGVELEALQTIPGTYYVQGDTVLLMGEDAYRYVQYRNVEEYESALDRQQRQVQFVKAFMKKASSNGAKGLIDLYNGVAGEITTNLGASEVAYLASVYASGKNKNLEFVQLTGKTEIWADADGLDREHYYLDSDSVTETLLSTFYEQVD